MSVGFCEGAAEGTGADDDGLGYDTMRLVRACETRPFRLCSLWDTYHV